jgi:hypothetical protein
MKAQIRVIGLTLLLFTSSQLMFQVRCEAQVKNMTAEELALESTSILYGKCTNMESAWTENNEMIFTTVTVVPEYYLKGNMGSEVTITVPGGQVGDIVYEVSEMPAFQKDEEVFTFIWKHASGKNLITGGYLGKLKIDTDAQTGRRTVSGGQLSTEVPEQVIQEPTTSTETATKSAQVTTPSETKPNKVSLDDFTREIEGYLNQR